MQSAEVISIVINLLVGVYFAWYYPRSVRKKLSGGQLPPAFVFLLKYIPLFGYFVIAITLVYAIYRLLPA